VLNSFIHFGIGANLVGSDKAYGDQVRYLTLQNGLYDLIKYRLVPHSPKIFTTNLLPYDYDPSAECPRFLQYLNEVFIGDVETIDFIQEAVGYAFYKAMPIPAIFFLIGEGSNGKSVFTETLTNLCGPENASSISLNLLSKEYYLLDLFGKMINVSSETPKNRMINTDLVKAVVAGDWVAGREPYKGPCKFKPFAKHFLAMNEIPTIDDTSHGMWRRVYIIEFPKMFSEDEMDVFLVDKLKNELSGIFNWAIEGYKKLKARNFRFKEGRSMKASKQNYKNQSNSVLSFASEIFKPGDPEKDSVKFKDAYDLYLRNCENERVKEIEKKTAFRKILENAGYEIDNSKTHNNQLRIFGVKVKSENNLELAA
jgi:putative DNA primase/helicase